MTDGDADPFISELKRWRDTRGLSQSAMARAMGYHRTYLSKIEGGQERATTDFATRAENVLKSGGALLRAFREGVELRGSVAAPPPPPPDNGAESVYVEQDFARLVYDGTTYQATQRRTIRNGGSDPMTGYLIRISVDRFPGNPERSNRLYREDPLTWEELQLTALHDGCDPMRWRVQHDRDAFKEVWLLFENDEGRFPLYPGESTTIEYSYTVADAKWGHWFQRAVRLPTRRLSVELDFPADLEPAVWGTQTTMAVTALPLPTAIFRASDRGRLTFAWSIDDPPLHARYRMEWNFRGRRDIGQDTAVTKAPSEKMTELGIAQVGDPILERPSRSFDLPVEAEDARRVVAELVSTLDRVAQAHNFSKGMGLSAPQIGIDRSAAVVRPVDGDVVVLLNAQIIDQSDSGDEQYEGCLSFFDVRGKVPRAHVIHVEHQDFDGVRRITAFERGMARLVAHEADHLVGLVYTARMTPGVAPISVNEYSEAGRGWQYPHSEQSP